MSNKKEIKLKNDFADVINDIVMPEAMAVLRENAKTSGLVYSDFGGAVEEKGNTINITLPADMGEAEEFVPGVGIEDTDIAPTKVSVVLDKHYGKQFAISDKEVAEIKTELALPSAAEGSVKAIANFMNTSIYNSYKDIPSLSGDSATAAFSYSTLVDAETIMSDNLAPETSDKYAVLNSTRYGQLLKSLNKVNETGSDIALRNAQVGELAGFTVYRDQLLNKVRHTNGTASTETMTAQLTIAKGSVTIPLTDVLTGDMNEGDVLSITLSDGTEQQNAVKSVAANQIVTFKYPLEGQVDAGAAISYVCEDANYDVNLGFQSNFYALAVRPLASEADEFSGGAFITTQVDPISGIPMKLEIFRDSQTGQRKWRFEVLFGGIVARPQLATRILASA